MLEIKSMSLTDYGSYKITLIAEDEGLLTSDLKFDLNVINKAPVITENIPDITMTHKQFLSKDL